jgi:hypothetical protein
VTRLIGAGRVTFAALAVPNYRRYIAGQSVSLIGTWMQMAAQSWLVFSISHSATTLGVIVALQTLPVLLLGPYGGVIADRVDKRRLRHSSSGCSPSRATCACGRSAYSPFCSASTTPSRTLHDSPSCSRWSAPRACATRSA